MAQSKTNDGSYAWLAFMLGALVVVTAVIGYFMFTGAQITPTRQVEVRLETPSLPQTPSLPDAPRLPMG